MRFLAGFATVLAALATALPSVAQPSKEECLDAYRVNQRLRHDGKLIEARQMLLVCARDPCPPALQKDCVDWLHELDDRLPSIVVGATDAHGDVQDVTVSIDGARFATRLDGRAIDVDPGPHHFKLEHRNDAPIERDLVVREGEKARRLDVRFGPVALVTTDNVVPRFHRPVRAPVIAVGLVGIASLATAAGFGIAGLSLRSNLDDCKPNCSDVRLSPVRTDFLVADVTGAISRCSRRQPSFFSRVRRFAKQHTRGSAQPERG